MDEDSLKTRLDNIEFITILILISLVFVVIKFSKVEEKVDKIAEQATTEQTIEEITTQAATEALIEPSDDEIQIELREEYKGGEHE